MKSSHSLVLLSLTSLIIVVTLFLINRFIFPKKKINPFFISLIFSFLPTISIFRPGSYESGDLWLHTTRFIIFYESISQRIFFPNWGGDLNNTFGYPILMFDPPLQYYIASIFHFLGFSYLVSMKLFLALGFGLAGVFMYIWAKEKFGKLAGFVGAIFYTYAPFHLVDTHFRVSIGEASMFAFIPSTLLTTEKLFLKPSLLYFVLNSLSLFFLIIASPTSIVPLTFIFFYILFLFIKNNKIKNLFYLSISYLLGFLLSSFYLFPVLFEGKFTHHAMFHKEVVYITISDLLFKSYMFGFLFQGHFGELTYLIGFTQLIVISVLLFLIYKNKLKKENSFGLFLIISLIITCFLTTKYSEFIWNILPIYKNLQFSFRLLILVSFLSSAIAVLVSTKINKKIVYIFCMFAIITTILNWGNRKNIPVQTDKYIISGIPEATLNGEGGDPASPIWTINDPRKVWEMKKPINHLEIISGEAKSKEIDRKINKHVYEINVTKNTYFKENTLYFPNWQIYANNKKLNINYQNKKYPGIMTFNLPKGKYNLTVFYEDTNVRKLSKILSFISLITLSGLAIVGIIKNRL